MERTDGQTDRRTDEWSAIGNAGGPHIARTASRLVSCRYAPFVSSRSNVRRLTLEGAAAFLTPSHAITQNAERCQSLQLTVTSLLIKLPHTPITSCRLA